MALAYVDWEKWQSLYVVDLVTACWNWIGAKTWDGYGTYNAIYVHRAFYETLVGPIPIGYEVDHLCRNTSCVNPKHLEPVTRKMNNNRGLRTKVTDAQVEEIRRLRASGMRVTHIAQLYGLRQGSVSNILRGARR